ncbi:hypothetical protein GRJ2_003137500 [Grus japonensis]|uniref:Uncharacterized protein n=1 Tax=Grus japonensis TaxID=30415 RepID=A0ABC9YAM4_GRUJA
MCNDIIVQQVTENIVDKALKGSRGITQAKRYHMILKTANVQTKAVFHSLKGTIQKTVENRGPETGAEPDKRNSCSASEARLVANCKTFWRQPLGYLCTNITGQAINIEG